VNSVCGSRSASGTVAARTQLQKRKGVTSWGGAGLETAKDAAETGLSWVIFLMTKRKSETRGGGGREMLTEEGVREGGESKEIKSRKK